MELKLFTMDVWPYCTPILDIIEKERLDIEIINLSNIKGARKMVMDIGGKLEVPMLSIDGKGMYDVRKIVDWVEENMDKIGKK